MKTLIVATALTAGTVLALPVTAQAMPVAPVKIQAAQDGNIVKADYRKKKWRGEKRRWRGDRWRWRESRRWRGDRWYGHRKWRRHRYYDPYYYDPYYYGGYYGPGYGYYGPGYWGGPGIGLQFRIN